MAGNAHWRPTAEKMAIPCQKGCKIDPSEDISYCPYCVNW